MAEYHEEHAQRDPEDEPNQSIDPRSQGKEPQATADGGVDAFVYACQYDGGTREGKRQAEPVIGEMFAYGGTLRSAVQDGQRSLLDKIKHRAEPDRGSAGNPP